MPTIAKMTLVATDIKAMVAFYNAVLGADFTPVQNAPEGFYSGKIAGIGTLLCPNSIAQVNAKQNRQQFDFIVEDIEASIQASLDSGGRLLEALSEQNGIKTASVYDPDGNSMVFIQKTP